MNGARVGRHCNIGDGAFIEAGAVVGDNVTIKNQAMIWEGVQIEDDAFIGPGVIFTNDRIPRSPRMREVSQRYLDPRNWRVETVVRRGATIGAGAVILPGITVGAYAMIAAGAIVTADVAPHRLVIGSPARPVGWVCVCGGRLDDAFHCALCDMTISNLM
jgi:acetyltransferase-like isoleucine patch superfamily enzyme